MSDFGQLRSGVDEGCCTSMRVEFLRIYEDGSSDVCPGDSGGPLLLQVGNQLTIAGITSYGVSSSKLHCWSNDQFS